MTKAQAQQLLEEHLKNKPQVPSGAMSMPEYVRVRKTYCEWRERRDTLEAHANLPSVYYVPTGPYATKPEDIGNASTRLEKKKA